MKHYKQEIFKTLSEYFDVISSKQIDNITESLELFNKYIRPLTNLFKELKGFHMATKLWIMILWTLPFFILLYFLKASIYFYIGLGALIILFMIRQLYFKRQKKHMDLCISGQVCIQHGLKIKTHIPHELPV